MKKFLIATLMLLTPVLALAGFNDNLYTVSVINQNASLHATVPSGKIESGVLTFVYTAGTKTLATLYSNNKRTSLANPITRANFATNKGLKFWAAAATVDIVLAHSDGSVASYSSVTPSMHSLVLNQDGSFKTLVIPFTPVTVETDSGIDVPLNSIITDAAVEVVTADSAQTLDVGLLSSETNGDANGILAGVLMTNTGLIRGWSTVAGGSEKYVDLFSFGALMGAGVVGTDSASDFGLANVPGHYVTGANAVSVTYTGSASTTTAAGYIYLYLKRTR